MHLIAAVLSFVSILQPARGWSAPGQPINVVVDARGDFTLMLTEFSGREVEPTGDANLKGGQHVDAKKVFSSLLHEGSYILYAAPRGKSVKEFVGTPLVITVRQSNNPAVTEPIVAKVEPLVYAVMSTEMGDMTFIFYYDAAPNTVANFVSLASAGFYDGLTFHRIVPDFVVQGGDPLGDGNGGPGYHIEAELNDKKHDEGVISMARQKGRHEAPGIAPDPEAANTAGSQFFICLNYENTKALDRKYTAFGRITSGLKTLHAIAKAPLASEETNRPVKPPVIKSVTIKPVRASDNPYRVLPTPTTLPTTLPSTLPARP